MKTSNKELVAAAIFVGVVGIVFGASCLPDFLEAARQNPALSRFLLGYTCVWMGVNLWTQWLHRKSLTSVIQAASQVTQARTKSKPTE